MNELMLMQSLPIERKEFNGQPVVTLPDIDKVHERPEGTARRTFNYNKRFFIEGVDYFERNPSEAANEFGIIAPSGLKLFTQTGYLMIVKSFTDDLSWAIQRKLVNGYFTRQQQGLTFMGTPVIRLADAAKALNVPNKTLLCRMISAELNMGDALLLEGRSLARFKQENRLHTTAAACWILSASGYEKLKAAVPEALPAL